MKQTHKLFKLFLPIIIGFTLLSTLLGIFMLAFNYTDEQGIYFKAAAPILFFAFVLISIGISIFFVFKIDHVYISKTKHDCPFFQFGSVLVFLVVFALTIYDLATFLQYQTLDTARIFKILRLIVAVPFLGHLILSVFPKRFRRQKIEIPRWLRLVCSVSAVVWCLFGLLAVWFYESQGYTYFKVTHIVFYVLMTLFFLLEAKNMFVKPCSKLLILSSLMLFVTSIAFALSTIFGIVIGKVVSMQLIGISEFELICSFAFALYALSKVFAYKTTLKYVIDTNITHYISARGRRKLSLFGSNKSKAEENAKVEKAPIDEQITPAEPKAEDKKNTATPKSNKNNKSNKSNSKKNNKKKH
ncbi:MAG: hypothetical protein IJA82_06150 [Clostridia bacterium]|nr:hypothetical protein [Clostridia bacterium]